MSSISDNQTNQTTSEQQSEKQQPAWKQKLRSMTEKQKYIFATIATLVVIIAFVAIGITANNFTNQKTAVQTPTDPESLRILSVVNNLNQVTAQANPEKLIWDEVKLTELDIYPPSWVEANFSEAERSNSLISGPAGDPDQDGLTNKTEYLIGSNPKNKYTICGGPILNENEPCGKTDKENFEAGISPLTGIKIEQEPVFRVKKATLGIAQNLDDAFDNGYRQGLDFPTLYQQSTLLDFSDQLSQVQVNTIENNREATITYFNKLNEVMGELGQASALSSFLDIYKLTQKSNIDSLVSEYTRIYNGIKDIPVPQNQQNYHQALVFFVQKILDLATYRSESFENTVAEQEQNIENKNKGLELMWAYRKLKSTESLPT
jgi:hypothetical protein